MREFVSWPEDVCQYHATVGPAISIIPVQCPRARNAASGEGAPFGGDLLDEPDPRVVYLGAGDVDAVGLKKFVGHLQEGEALQDVGSGAQKLSVQLDYCENIYLF